MTNTGTANGACTLNDSPNWVTSTVAGTYTGTMWVRADVNGAILKLRFREYVGTTNVGSASTQITLTTGWQQVTVSYTPAAGSALDFNAYLSSAPTGVCFYADDAAITVN